MEVGVQLIIMVILGAVAAAIAGSKGRSAIGWFFGGLFLGLIGIIIVAVLPNLKEAEARRDHDRSERRRLREQLQQERMKSEAYRRHAAARLDAHDQHLGVDTRQLGALPQGHGGHFGLAAGEADPLAEGGAAAFVGGQPAGAFPEPAFDAPRAKEWFYELRGESRGPVSEAAIRTGLANGRIHASTLIWREGMATWQAVSEVALFSTGFPG